VNSIFMGEKLLTTPNPKTDRDRDLFDKLGMRLTESEPLVGASIAGD
jgi:biotin synthase